MNKTIIRKALNFYNQSSRNLSFEFPELEKMINSNPCAWKKMLGKVRKYYKEDLQIVYNLMYNYISEDFNCYYCYRQLDLESFTLDHFYPKSLEKEQQVRLNMELMQCCKHCNKIKSNYTPEELKKIVSEDLKVRQSLKDFANIFLIKIDKELFINLNKLDSTNWRDYHNSLCIKFTNSYK